MRDYNPAIVSYMNMQIDDVAVEDKQPMSTGLLAPRNRDNKATQEDVTQPYTRIAKHMRIIRNKRDEINGV